MPAQQYALDKKLIVSWEAMWQNVTVTYGERQVGRIADGKEILQKGRTFRLPNGSQLTLRLVGSSGREELQAEQNGKLLFPLRSRDGIQLQRAYIVLVIVGLLNMGLGLAQLLLKLDPLKFANLGIAGIISVLTGVALIGTGLLLWRQRSLAILYSGITLYIIDGIWGYYYVIQQGGEPSIVGIVARAWFLFYLFQGIASLTSTSPNPRS